MSRWYTGQIYASKVPEEIKFRMLDSTHKIYVWYVTLLPTLSDLYGKCRQDRIRPFDSKFFSPSKFCSMNLRAVQNRTLDSQATKNPNKAGPLLVINGLIAPNIWPLK